VIKTISRVGSQPIGVALPFDGSRVWVSSQDHVAVINDKDMVNNEIDLPTNCHRPFGLDSDTEKIPEGRQFILWIALSDCNEVEAAEAKYYFNIGNTLYPTGAYPVAFGQFMGPTPKAAGPAAQSAAAAGDPCSGPFDATVNGNLTVAEGDSCQIVNGGQVTGNVTVSGGNFVLSGAPVGGSVTVDGGRFTIGPAATVGGDVLVSNVPAGPKGNSVCGTTVEGTVQADGNAAPVQIGSASPMVCAGNKIGGDLVVDGNSAAAQVFDNQVSGSLQASNNTGLLDVVGNSIGTTLQCQNNTMLILGGNNTAAQKTGQCN
jgi:hypothetical protein